jgi:hypothetical protein
MISTHYLYKEATLSQNHEKSKDSLPHQLAYNLCKPLLFLYYGYRSTQRSLENPLFLIKYMKEKLGTDSTYWEKTGTGKFCSLFQIFGFTLPHLSVHIIIPKGKWRVIYSTFVLLNGLLQHSTLERKFTVQTLLYIKTLAAS